MENEEKEIFELSDNWRKVERSLGRINSERERLHLSRTGKHPEEFPPISEEEYRQQRQLLDKEYEQLKQSSEYLQWEGENKQHDQAVADNKTIIGTEAHPQDENPIEPPAKPEEP